MKKALRSIVLLVIVFTSILMMYMPYVELKRSAVEDLNNKQELIAEQTAFSIESFFSEQHKMLHHFASHPTFINFDNNIELTLQREYNLSSDYIKGITVYDKKGIIRYSYPSPEKTIGKDISSQAHVKKILRDHKPSVSDVFFAIQGYKTVAVSQPIFKDDIFVGVVAFLVDFKYIAKNFLENIRIGQNGYAWMISRDGTELYCPVPNHTGVNVFKTSAEFDEILNMARSMMRGESGVTTYTYDMVKDSKTKIEKKHAVYMPINVGDTFWSVVIATPENEIYSTISVFMRKMILAMVFLLVAVLFYVVISINDYNLAKRNQELQDLVDIEIAKREKQERLMLQQARFYSMTETLSAIAHQWRQPLNSIGLCVQDLEEAYSCGELDKQYLENSVNNTMKSLNSLSSTIDDFRNFFVEDTEASEVDVSRLVYNIYDIVRVKYDALNIVIRFTANGVWAEHSGFCSDEKYVIKTYPDMLKQAVLNCLQNSREAIEKLLESGGITKGEIWLKLSEDNGLFQLEIIDNGGGIDRSLREKIFDPYFTTKNMSIGMGQGLYVTKYLVEESLGGNIEIDNVNNGARVVIKFKSL